MLVAAMRDIQLAAIVTQDADGPCATHAPVVVREDGSLLIEGLISVDDLRVVLDVDELPDDDSYQTLGGFVVHMFGRLPRAGEVFNWADWRFEVVDMDGNRVDKVLVNRLAS